MAKHGRRKGGREEEGGMQCGKAEREGERGKTDRKEGNCRRARKSQRDGRAATVVSEMIKGQRRALPLWEVHVKAR